MSSISHKLRNIYKKATNDQIKEYAEKKLQEHIKYFKIVIKLLEGEDNIRDEVNDILIKILWSFCSVKGIL